MSIDELRLILSTVEHVSDGAMWIALVWVATQVLNVLMWPVCLAIVGYVVLRIFRMGFGTDLEPLIEAAGISCTWPHNRERLIEFIVKARKHGVEPGDENDNPIPQPRGSR